MTVRAKMICREKFTDQAGGTSVRFGAIYSQKGENKDFTDATPNGNADFYISQGKVAADEFDVDQAYYFDISPAPAE